MPNAAGTPTMHHVEKTLSILRLIPKGIRWEQDGDVVEGFHALRPHHLAEPTGGLLDPMSLASQTHPTTLPKILENTTINTVNDGVYWSSMSKAKGNSGERELCSKLKAIFGGSFIRVPNSGAFTGGKNAVRREVLSDGQIRSSKGDIIPPDFMPKLVLEVKWYKEFRFHQLLQPGGCVQLDGWILQSMDAIDEGDLWFVAFKINLRGWFIAIPRDTSEGYALGNHAIYTCKGYGDMLVTEAETFLAANRDLILARSA
jgi:hypothetical protein